MAYDIQVRRKAQKTLTKIPEPYQTRIIDAIRNLSYTPHPTTVKNL